MRIEKILITALCLALLCIASAGTASAAEPQTYKNSIGMEFVLIPAGSFEWEADVEESRNAFGEPVRTVITPARKVTISKPFYLGIYEVTQEQWYAVMGNNPAKFLGRHNPVEQVSWDEVQVFIRKLNQKEGTTRYRLPTEAEWELAAGGGTGTRYFFGGSEGALGQYAWYRDNSGGNTHSVGQKKPNRYGLYDIYGNVWEWVQDWYGEYPKRAATDPKGPTSGSSRVVRGGGWGDYAENCRSGYRGDDSPGYRLGGVGFRLALSPE